MRNALVSMAVLGCLILSSIAADGTITYEPADGAGKGKHIVLVCGEWEYRCEESRFIREVPVWGIGGKFHG